MCMHKHTYLCVYGNNFTGSDYYAYPTSVRIPAGADKVKVTIRTREDSNLENKYEYFDVKIDYPSKPNNSFCDELSVTIEDDDGTYLCR